MDSQLWFTEEIRGKLRLSLRVKEQLYSAMSPFQQIEIFDTYEHGRMLVLDGYIMITEKDEFIYHEMISHVPLAVNPAIGRVLIIGGGDGGSVRELLKYPFIRQIDMVEIDQMVVEACQRFIPSTAAWLCDPRVKLYFQDGIKYMAEQDNCYDLILVDSTDPEGPGEVLFSRPFYQNCYKALTSDGILVNQHESPFYQRDAEDFIKAASQLEGVFPVYQIYQFHLPTYSSGYWLFGFSSKGLDPIADFSPGKWQSLNIATNYYNPELHRGAFALPNYVQRIFQSKIYQLRAENRD